MAETSALIHPPPQDLPRSLRSFLIWIVVITTVCLCTEAYCNFILGYHHPYNWPLVDHDAPFRDFSLYKARFDFFHSPAFFTFQDEVYLYPAPPSLVYRLFFYFPHSTAVFLTSYCIAFLGAATLFGRALVARGLNALQVTAFLAVTLLCSYPFFFEFQQANLEWTVWLLVTAGLWAFLRGRGYTAAACFGIAGAMKIYPLIFLGLLISQKQYRKAAAGIAVCALTTIVSLWALCPDIAIAWHGTQQGLESFRKIYILQYIDVGYDHSLFAIPKAAAGSLKYIRHTSAPPPPAVLAKMLSIYLPALALAGTILYFTRVRTLPIANQILFLSIATILLPPVSFDYTLIHLYAPWALLIFYLIANRAKVPTSATLALLCFAIVFSPETEAIWSHHTFAGQIKCLALLTLAGISLHYRFPTSFDTVLLETRKTA